MIFLKGRVENGVRHFEQRMTSFSHVFEKATGERLYPGTLNVKIGVQVPVKEHFRIKGSEICEPDQDLVFEICRIKYGINWIWAYRIRPYNIHTGGGGHGDDTLEIACSKEIPNIHDGSEVEIALFRDGITQTT